ncbi:2Fe-2S ferredoxin-like superfamily protein [Zea mays]|uniref:2Fe-2S ferredoxin-like superfamily protein n=1 Tax=Zea mays TaxID=4577 RepID=A0A1D6MYM5_MAIZE|nr:2Fe-2S ferredoxin-like superfamily protein [Zea mays]
MNENKIKLYAAYVGSAFLLLHLCCAVACLTKRGLAVSLARQGDELRWRRKLWHLHRRGTSSPPQSTAPNIIDGKELLNERTSTENRYLKKKPDSWRLACQTIVGNKENSGKASFVLFPTHPAINTSLPYALKNKVVQ